MRLTWYKKILRIRIKKRTFENIIVIYFINFEQSEETILHWFAICFTYVYVLYIH